MISCKIHRLPPNDERLLSLRNEDISRRKSDSNLNYHANTLPSGITQGLDHITTTLLPSSSLYTHPVDISPDKPVDGEMERGTGVEQVGGRVALDSRGIVRRSTSRESRDLAKKLRLRGPLLRDHLLGQPVANEGMYVNNLPCIVV